MGNLSTMSRLRLAILALSFFTLLCTAGFANTQEPLTLEIHPYLPATEIAQRFTPLADYLGSKIGRPVVIKIAKDYDEHIDEIGKDKVDIAYMGPASYVKLVEKYGRKPILARQEINGKPTFKGAIIVVKESPIRGLADLKGKRFAFGDPDSTMSHLVPRYMLWKAGVDIKDLRHHVFLSNHHNVVLGVLSGDFDAGAVKDDVFYEYEKRGIRALVWTPAISEHLFVTRSNLPEKTVKQLRAAFYGLKDDREGAAVMTSIHKNMTGMAPARDEDYDNLRGILRSLKRLGVQP